MTKTLLCLESSEKDTPGWVSQGEEAFSRLVSKAERVSAKGIVCAHSVSYEGLVASFDGKGLLRAGGPLGPQGTDLSCITQRRSSTPALPTST